MFKLTRLLIDPRPHSGAWNMAVDELLLEAAITEGVSTLRLYEWDVPTVSIGHFQAANDPVVRERFPKLPVVRRLSGGGAILHHHELTYSLAMAPGHPLAADPTTVYAIVHMAIIRVLNTLGVASIHMRGDAVQNEREPFLCFGRGDPRDLVIDHHKVLGSAQRRRRGAVLQHGALLLRQSLHAPEFPGLFELAGLDAQPSNLTSALAQEIWPVLRMPESLPSPAPLTTTEAQQAERLAADYLVSG